MDSTITDVSTCVKECDYDSYKCTRCHPCLNPNLWHWMYGIKVVFRGMISAHNVV